MGHPSFAQACEVPDVFGRDHRLDDNFPGASSFHSSELFQDQASAEPLIFGDGADHHACKPLHPGRLSLEETWDSSWQDTQSVPRSAEGCASVPSAAAPPTATWAASGAAATDPDAPLSRATGGPGGDLMAAYPNPALSAPHASAGLHPSSMAAASSPALLGHRGPHAACTLPYMPPQHRPHSVDFMPQWVAYLPASLQPQAEEDEEAAAEHAQARSLQLSRFRRKKQRLSVPKTVRYKSRKRYADARPRVNGRFISKAQGAAAASATAM